MPNLNNMIAALLGGAPSHPTKEQILAEPEPTFKPEVLRFVREWKRERAGQLRTEESLTALIQGLGAIYDKQLTVRFDPGASSSGCDYREGRILLNKGSIVSALHETAHCIFDTGDELKVCRWSVHLFKRLFRRTYERLEWRGHMLVVPGNEPSVAAAIPETEVLQ
jgi:hypothetical protein